MTQLWWRITANSSPKESDAVATFLVNLTGEGVEESSTGTIHAIARDQQHAQEVLDQLQATFPGLTATITPLPSVDWGTHWRDGIITRYFGRVVITPSWLPVQPEGDQVVVVIDPESAFGNGEHGSTRVALTLLDRNLCAGDRVLDLGSGSGVLAITAALLGATHAIGIEIDPEAIPVAVANAQRNGVIERVGFLVGDAEQFAPLAGPAELICSNILRTINIRLLPVIAASLAPGGKVLFSGMESGERELFLTALTADNWQLVDQATDSGWWGVVVTRR